MGASWSGFKRTTNLLNNLCLWKRNLRFRWSEICSVCIKELKRFSWIAAIKRCFASSCYTNCLHSWMGMGKCFVRGSFNLVEHYVCRINIDKLYIRWTSKAPYNLDFIIGTCRHRTISCTSCKCTQSEISCLSFWGCNSNVHRNKLQTSLIKRSLN